MERFVLGRFTCKGHLSFFGKFHWVQGSSCPNMTNHPANQLRLVVYPIIYMVFYIPVGAEFLPSTV